MRVLLCVLIFFLCQEVAWAQLSDTTELTISEYDTTTTTNSDSEYEATSNTTFTKAPAELKSTRQEIEKSYTEKKFSKTEWKKIVEGADYTEEAIQEKKKTEPARAWDEETLKIIAYVLIIGMIVAAIFLFFKNALTSRNNVKIVANNPLLYETSRLDDVTETDLERLLREALGQNDFRAAVRIYYLKLLKHLDATGHIAWKMDKTNRDYAAELSSTSFIRDFRRLMMAYEIIWYGERTPSTEEFKKIQLSFNTLQSQAIRTA